MLTVAKAYIEAGYWPIPVPLKTKAPVLKDWPSVHVTEENADRYFTSEESNIGILLGVGDYPIADVDCDCLEAITAAEHLLPETWGLFGRRSSPRSHYLYCVERPVESKRFEDPIATGEDKTLVEFRCAKKGGSVGLQTIVPPSIHPSGERIQWDGCDEFPDKLRQFTTVNPDNLKTTVTRVAAAALLARYWPKAGEGRHEAMLALAGVLVRSNWSESEAQVFCNAVYRSIAAPDISQLDRANSEVESTFAKFEANQNITGLTTLKKLINETVLERALDWLEVAPHGTAPTRDPRPHIQLRNRTLDEKTDDCISVLSAGNEPPTLFLRQGKVATVRTMADNTATLHEVSCPQLTSVLSRRAVFLKGDQKTDPSDMVTRNVLITLETSSALPLIEGIVSAPVIRPDGSILAKPGYDAASKLYCAPPTDLRVPEVPEKPNAEDVRAALTVIDDVIGEFPFVDESSRANMVAAMLTPIVRPAITGPTPLAILDATAPGTGKTLLAKVVSIIATGADAAMMTVPKNQDEWRKKITTVLRTGTPVVIFDNVSKRLDADELMSVLTLDSWSDRLLGSNEQGTYPNRSTWIVTATNVELEAQMVRRSYLVKLDAKTARPSARSGFKHSNLELYVKENRGEILAALLTIASAWFAEGKHPPRVNPMGSFESWAIVVGGILENAGIHGFLGNVEQLHARADDETQIWDSLLAQLFDAFKGKAFTTSDVLRAMDSPMNDDLRDNLEAIFGEAISNRSQLKQRLPREFKKRLETRFRGDNETEYWLETAGTLHRVARWTVRSNSGGKPRELSIRQTPKKRSEAAA